MGKFDNIFIITDVDNTFLRSDRSLSERNVEAIKYFVNEGGKFTFATGRVHSSLLRNVSIASELANAPGVMANGTYLYDFKLDKVLDASYLPEKEAREVADFIFAYNDEFGMRFATTRGTIYARIPPDYLGDYERLVHKNLIVEEQKDWRFDDCYKIVVRGRCEELNALRAEVEARFANKFAFVKSEATFFEIQNKNCSKGEAINSIRKHYRDQGVEIKVYACGDYENDISMLKVADVAVCPENASDSVKDICHMHLCHCNDGVIGDLIERL